MFKSGREHTTVSATTFVVTPLVSLLLPGLTTIPTLLLSIPNKDRVM
jgi:hypothetical protein